MTGMTWEDWVNSEYNVDGTDKNTGGFWFDNNQLRRGLSTYIYAYKTELIIEDNTYNIKDPFGP
jgi:uncharacterized membrane protein